MKIKQMIQWQLMTNRFAFILFYLIVAALTACDVIALTFYRNFTFTVTAIIYTGIFLLVVGLASFSENLRFALANGVSRRTHYVSFLIVSIILCAISSIFCVLVDKISNSALPSPMALISSPPLDEFVFAFALFLLSMTFGYFLSGGYYRMSKFAKVLVTVLVPVLLIVFILYTVLATPGLLFVWMTSGLLPAAFVCFILAVIFALLGWLVTRRAEIKAH